MRRERPLNERWRRLRSAGAGRLLAAVASIALPGCGARPAPERVILVVVDTLRRDHVASYGGSTATPNIDALASRGQRFRRALSSYHQTSMSMGSLFTGRTPSIEFGTLERPLFWNGETWCGLNRFASERGDDTCVPPSLPTLAQLLQGAGYWTIGIASNQFLYEPSGFARGFDDWVEVGEHPEQKGAIARLEIRHGPSTRHQALVNAAAFEALDRRGSDRFLLYVHYMDVHDYGFGLEPSTGPRERAGRYAAAVGVVDRAIGELLERLERDGLLDDAVVIVTADHGERLTERHALAGQPAHVGNPSFQELLEVPLVIAPATDRDPEQLIRTEDLFRLILEIVGLAAPAPPELRPGELLLAETEYRTYLDGRWKSVIRRADGAQHLFDLAADPGELHDVAASQPAVASAHRERIDGLSQRLSARNQVLQRLSPDDRARLEALGYGYSPTAND